MFTNSEALSNDTRIETNPSPNIFISKLGIVSRDYWQEFQNGFRDFSYFMPEILGILDREGCDAVLFSLFSIVPRDKYDVIDSLNGLKDLKAILLEEFQDGEKRHAEKYNIYYKEKNRWECYSFTQKFGSLAKAKPSGVYDFVNAELEKRVIGNGCVLLCGETNGVKYSKNEKKVVDAFGLDKSIKSCVRIILNPIHDRMTRFEMKLKRAFLSEKNRWVVSVWNKGKKDKNGKIKDGPKPAWTIYCNGKEVIVPKIEHNLPSSIEIGIIKFS